MAKAYKVEILIIDAHDEMDERQIQDILENTRYPNRCICPEVKNIITKDIGEWHDDHPFNLFSQSDKEYKKIF